MCEPVTATAATAGLLAGGTATAGTAAAVGTATAVGTTAAVGTTSAVATSAALGTSAAVTGGVSGAALSMAGPGMFASTALAPATAGAGALAPLGASFASAAPSAFTFGSLLSGANQFMNIASPLFSAADALSGAGDLKELGRMQAEAALIGMNQDLLEQRMVALERREKANQELAGLLAGGQAGQSLVALTQKKLDEAERDRQFSETMIGNIEIRGRTRVAEIESRTEQAVAKAQSDAGEAAGQAVGFLAQRYA